MADAGEASTFACVWFAHDSANAPDAVTGEPDTENSDGAVSPTLVTVPEPPPPPPAPATDENTAHRPVNAGEKIRVIRFVDGY